MRMPQEIKTKWIEALRSGEYKQGREWLLDNGGGYCCLGVLQMCVLGDVERDDAGHPERLPTAEFWKQLDPARVETSTPELALGLAEMNDGVLAGVYEGCRTFEELATIIESEVLIAS